MVNELYPLALCGRGLRRILAPALFALTAASLLSCGSGGDARIQFRSLHGVSNAATITTREVGISCTNCIESVTTIKDAAALESEMQFFEFSRPPVTATYLPQAAGFYNGSQIILVRIKSALEYRVSVTKIIEDASAITVYTEVCDAGRVYGFAGVFGVWIVIPKTDKPIVAAPLASRPTPPNPENPSGPGGCTT